METKPFINKELDIPIYLQIYQYFRDEIEQRRLIEGVKLPSIRQLSRQINVSRNTVEIAYQQLVAEGYLESKEKRGLFVLGMEGQLPILEEQVPNKRPFIHNVKNEKKRLIDFQYGDIELEQFPIKDWKKCLLETIENPSQNVFAYGEKKGHWGLRGEIASYLYQARGVSCSPEQIILTAGIQPAIQILIHLLDLRTKRVALENPGYDGVRHIFNCEQCEIIPISLEEDGIKLEEVEDSKASCVYVTPSHQFPQGMVLPIQKRMRLLQWAEKNESYIIEDDYDGEFRYIGYPIPSLKSLDTNERVIYLGTFSKAFLPGVRLSYIVLPSSLLQKFDSELFFVQQTVSPILQEATFQFMKRGYFSKHIRKMRKIYQGKHKTLVDTIELYLGDKVKIVGQKSGLHLLIELNDVDSGQFIKKAEEAGVKVYSTDRFWYKASAMEVQRHIMVGFAGLSHEEIKMGIFLLSKILGSLG